MKKQTNAKEVKKYIVHDGYIGTFQYFDRLGFPIYRFPGGDCVGDSANGFDDRKSAEEYALKEYGHIN